MANFVDVPPCLIEEPLRLLGFDRTVEAGQIVYIKQHDCCSSVFVKVYTSIHTDGSAVRRRGKDSIRVATIYSSRVKSFGIGKFPYIARISSSDRVVKKMLTTVKAAWDRGQEWFDQVQVKQVMTA